MSRATAPDSIKLRPFRDEDKPDVHELLATALGSGPAPGRRSELFNWKHEMNPFGRSLMFVAEADGRIAGLRAFMRWRFSAGDRTVSAVRAVDTATHPDYRRTGVFSRLTLDALAAMPNEVELVFNTPNQASLPGYLKMGWRIVGRVPVRIRVRRPLRFLGRAPSARTPARMSRQLPSVDAEGAAEALDDPAMGALLAEAEESSRLGTPRDLGYLRWRYGSAPPLDYRAVRDRRGGRLRGVAIFRIRPRGGLWESTVVELIGRKGDRDVGRRLLRWVVEASSVDHLACSFAAASGPARAARRCGFLRAPGGIALTVRPLAPVHPEPTVARSWALSLGDLEVF